MIRANKVGDLSRQDHCRFSVICLTRRERASACSSVVSMDATSLLNDLAIDQYFVVRYSYGWFEGEGRIYVSKSIAKVPGCYSGNGA